MALQDKRMKAKEPQPATLRPVNELAPQEITERERRIAEILLKVKRRLAK